MTHPQEQHPQVGGAQGQESPPMADTSSPQDADEPATGEIEIPLGVPISDEEFRRLKREAQRPTEADPMDLAGEDPEHEGDNDLE